MLTDIIAGENVPYRPILKSSQQITPVVAILQIESTPFPGVHVKVMTRVTANDQALLTNK